MSSGFDIFKYKDKLDRERAEREAKYGKKNTLGMKLARCFVYGFSATMIWSVSTTFAMPSILQISLNLVLIVAFAYLSYKTFTSHPKAK